MDTLLRCLGSCWMRMHHVAAMQFEPRGQVG